LHIPILDRLRLRHRFLLGFLFGSVNTVKRDGLQKRVITEQSALSLLPLLTALLLLRLALLPATKYPSQNRVKSAGLCGSSLGCTRCR
jgi:hypothetical protein